MPSIKQSSLLPYSAAQMYQLVNDYPSYPEFLPGCVASRTVSVDSNTLTAELTISKAGIKQSFITRNQMQVNQWIKMQLVEGPFRSLQGEWKFIELDQQHCQIQFQLDFEFSNPLIALAFGKIFTHLTQSMITSFKQRAKEVYYGAD